MSILTLTACLLGILFFMAGCLHIGMYVATTNIEPFAIFFSGLMLVSWPLAVAAVLFALLDISIRINNPTPRTRTEDEEDDIHEAPLRRTPAAASKPGSFSYFAVQPDTVPPEAIKKAKPKPKEPSIFATPPPFHKEEPPSPDEEPTGRPAPGSKETDSSSDLSFFKL